MSCWITLAQKDYKHIMVDVNAHIQNYFLLWQPALYVPLASWNLVEISTAKAKAAIPTALVFCDHIAKTLLDRVLCPSEIGEPWTPSRGEVYKDKYNSLGINKEPCWLCFSLHKFWYFMKKIIKMDICCLLVIWKNKPAAQPDLRLKSTPV